MERATACDRPVGFLLKVYPKLSETFILEEILALERIGVRVHLFALQRATDSIVHPRNACVRAPVSYVPDIAASSIPAYLITHLAMLAISPWCYLRALKFALGRRQPGRARDFLRGVWLAYAMARNGVTHVHAHFISEPAAVAEIAARVSGGAYSVSAHAKDIYLSTAASLRRKLQGARFTVTCTEYNRRYLRGIAPRATVHRMYHGIDLTFFHPHHREPPEDPPLILAVGRLREKKGFRTLVAACALLRDRRVRFRCEIAGYGEEQQAIDEAIRAAGLADLIRLPGKLPRDEIRRRYASASVFVLPSQLAADGDRDGIPNVLVEAMGMSVPVLSTRVSGIPELIRHEQNGLLVAPGEPVELADSLQRILGCPELADRLGIAGRKTAVEMFDNDRNVTQLCSHLQGAGAINATTWGSWRTEEALRDGRT